MVACSTWVKLLLNRSSSFVKVFLKHKTEATIFLHGFEDFSRSRRIQRPFVLRQKEVQTQHLEVGHRLLRDLKSPEPQKETLRHFRRASITEGQTTWTEGRGVKIRCLRFSHLYRPSPPGEASNPLGHCHERQTGSWGWGRGPVLWRRERGRQREDR